MATKDLDSVEFLTDETEIAAYLKAAAKYNDDSEYYMDCLAEVARARAINQLAEFTGVERNVIYEMLTEPKSVVWLRTCLIAVEPTEIAELTQV